MTGKTIDKTEIVVIGGGITGCSIAFYLAKSGKKVILVEKKAVASGATGKTAGGVRLQGWHPKEIPLVIESIINMWPGLEKELDYETEYTRGGNLWFAETKEDMNELEKRLERQKPFNLASRMITKREIEELAPSVSTANLIGAMYCPISGYANPFKVTYGYAQAAKKKGVKLCTETEVVGIDVLNNKVNAVITNRGRIKTDIIVNAAGAWGRLIGQMVKLNIPATPVRSQMMVTEQVPVLIKQYLKGFRVYCKPTNNGNIQIGDDVYQATTYSQDPTYEAIKSMGNLISRIVPQLKNASIIRAWAGIVGCTPDGLPILGKVGDLDGFILSVGLDHGFVLGPVIGRTVAELITTGNTSLPINEFNLSRFNGLDVNSWVERREVKWQN